MCGDSISKFMRPGGVGTSRPTSTASGSNAVQCSSQQITQNQPLKITAVLSNNTIFQQIFQQLTKSQNGFNKSLHLLNNHSQPITSKSKQISKWLQKTKENHFNGNESKKLKQPFNFTNSQIHSQIVMQSHHPNINILDLPCPNIQDLPCPNIHDLPCPNIYRTYHVQIYMTYHVQIYTGPTMSKYT